MKTTQQKLVDTLAGGFGLWILGFALGMMLFPFVPVARLGWFIVPVMAIVTVYVAYQRLRHSDETIGYFVLVGITWLAIAVVLDYLLIVKAFAAENYYDADIFIYYALSLLIPIVVGVRHGKSQPKASDQPES